LRVAAGSRVVSGFCDFAQDEAEKPKYIKIILKVTDQAPIPEKTVVDTVGNQAQPLIIDANIATDFVRNAHYGTSYQY
jgi:hypothetical protein